MILVRTRWLLRIPKQHTVAYTSSVAIASATEELELSRSKSKSELEVYTEQWQPPPLQSCKKQSAIRRQDSVSVVERQSTYVHCNDLVELSDVVVVSGGAWDVGAWVTPGRVGRAEVELERVIRVISGCCGL